MTEVNIRTILDKFRPKRVFKRCLDDYYSPKILPPEKIITTILEDNPEFKSKFKITSTTDWRFQLRNIRQTYGTTSKEYLEFSNAFKNAEYKVRNCGIDLEYPKILVINQNEKIPLIQKHGSNIFEHQDPWYNKENETDIHIQYKEVMNEITDQDRNDAIYYLASRLQ
jgi:hypothetical protein